MEVRWKFLSVARKWICVSYVWQRGDFWKTRKYFVACKLQTSRKMAELKLKNTNNLKLSAGFETLGTKKTVCSLKRLGLVPRIFSIAWNSNVTKLISKVKVHGFPRIRQSKFKYYYIAEKFFGLINFTVLALNYTCMYIINLFIDLATRFNANNLLEILFSLECIILLRHKIIHLYSSRLKRMQKSTNWLCYSKNRNNRFIILDRYFLSSFKTLSRPAMNK